MNLWDITGSKGYYELDEFGSSRSCGTWRCLYLSRVGRHFCDAGSLRDFKELEVFWKSMSLISQKKERKKRKNSKESRALLCIEKLKSPESWKVARFLEVLCENLWYNVFKVEESGHWDISHVHADFTHVSRISQKLFHLKLHFRENRLWIYFVTW